MSGGFDSLGLMPELIHATDDLCWNLPTDVQDEAIPLILGGGDVMAAAQTGSGKTAAFCLPIIQSVHERLIERSKVSNNNNNSQGQTIDNHLNHIHFNDNDRDIFLNLSLNKLECASSNEKLWVGVRATHGIRSGMYAYECLVKGSGICRLGWSTLGSSLELGRDSNGFGYGGTGMKSNSNNFQNYGEKFVEGDVITALLDWNELTISYSKNGKYLGVAFNIPSSLKGSVLYPTIALKGALASVNFGVSALSYTLPVGYTDIFHAVESDIVTVNKTENKVDSQRNPSAVILLPSRDLAEQVYQSLNDMSKYVDNPKLKTILLVGGDNYKDQKKQISDGLDIVVGTTGKIVDLVKSKILNFSNVKFFVLDEADRMIESDNIDSIMLLYQACPKDGVGEDRLQVCFFSATLHDPAIASLSESICHNPTWVDLKGKDSVPDTVHHVIYRVDPNKDIHLLTNSVDSLTDEVHVSNDKLELTEKNSLLVKQIKMQLVVKIIEKFQMSQVMIFCRTNVDCNNLETFFNQLSGQPNNKFISKIDTGKENKYSCSVLAGMRSMNQRRESLEAFKDGYIRILICTDVAARGIDIKGLPYVINMTLPDVPESYIHRIGRVGRGDCIGLAISLVSTYPEKVWYHGSNCRSKSKSNYVCTNRKLIEDGGCTIWYNELLYLTNIESRLSMKLLELDSDCNLPKELAENNIIYGESSNTKADSTNEEYKQHYKSIESTIIELNQLEIIAQNSYLSLYNNYI